MTTFTKSKDNLHLDGDRVISYTTHVATVDRSTGTLWVHGYWSRTTSKHISIAAAELGLEKKDDLEGNHKTA